ncbi:MAG TPA: hypothetical protein VF759_18075 [Allosphingosinicella sp.]|jgi:hypothetical protein
MILAEPARSFDTPLRQAQRLLRMSGNERRFDKLGGYSDER